MTIQEVFDKIDGFSEEERVEVLPKLVKLFCPVSQKSLVEFQSMWNPDKPFNEFVEAQNKVFKDCIKLETSDVGDIVRETLGLTKLEMTMEV